MESLQANQAALNAILAAQKRGHDSFKKKDAHPSDLDTASKKRSGIGAVASADTNSIGCAKSNSSGSKPTAAAAAPAPTLAGSAAATEREITNAFKGYRGKALDLFRDWDEDGNGLISKREFRRALSALGISGSKDDYDAVFARWDSDNSGELDFRELNRAMRKGTDAGPLNLEVAPEERTYESLEEEVAALRERCAVLVAERDKLLMQVPAEISAEGCKESVEQSAPTTMRLLRGRERLKAVGSVVQISTPRSTPRRASIAKDEKDQRRGTTESAKMTDGKDKSGSGASDEKEQQPVDEQTTWTAAKWLGSIGVQQAIAECLGLPFARGAKSQFEYIRSLDRSKLETLLSEVKLEGLTDFLVDAVASLKRFGFASASELNEKFQSSAKFSMSYGSLSLFYGGLESLIGPPKMVKGSLLNAMEHEHTQGADAKLDFDSPNGTCTTSATEWEVVVEPQEGKDDYPERDGFRNRHPEWCRRTVPLGDMLEVMEETCNARLRKDGHAEMIVEELVAGRLYTGPMYCKYNAVLRAKSGDTSLVDVVRKLCKSNEYATTIHAVNSCVIKLSKLTKACKVWRGIKDATLPKEFWVPNAMGVRGGIEYAFSSTTTEKAQALHYATGGSGDSNNSNRAMTIFEMQMGMVDRGADLSWLSQYPHEREVLLPPLTGIEALHTDVEGCILIVHARLSLNLAALTLEQVLSRRRKMLMDMTSGVELEVRDNLNAQQADTGVKLLKKALKYGPLSQQPDWFNDDENFATAMQQTLFLQRGIVNEIHRLPADSSHLDLHGWKASSPSRVLLCAGWVFSRPSQMELSIDLQGCSLTSKEGDELAQLMAAAPKLTSIDVRGNETLGKAGVEPLLRFMRVKRDITAGPRSLCGVTTSGRSQLVIQKNLTPVDCMILCAELENNTFSEGVSAGMGKSAASGSTTLNRRSSSMGSDWQPLLWAAKDNKLMIVEQLLEFGADINEAQPATQAHNKYTALHLAAMKGLTKMVELLLSHGADPALKDKHGNTARQLAEKKGHKSVLDILDSTGSTDAGKK